jgi:hypothetical protein
LDFARARRNPFFSLLPLDKVEHSLLPFRQHTPRVAHNSGDASSNEQVTLLNAFTGIRNIRTPGERLVLTFCFAAGRLIEYA